MTTATFSSPLVLGSSVITQYDSTMRQLIDPHIFSPVRRAFCLLAGFDIILIVLLWIIFINVSSGGQFDKVLKREIYEYNITDSLFDTVMLSCVRMLLLEIVYAIFRFQHWWMVALTTAVSTGFLIAKSFKYSFNLGGHPVDYFLLLASMIIPWIETWFLDFKVVPFEKKTKDIWEANRNTNERRPLLGGASYPGQPAILPFPGMYYTGFSTDGTSFYSPTSSFAGSDNDNESEGDDQIYDLTEEEQHLLESSSCCVDKLLEILTLSKDNWNVECCGEHGATVYSTNTLTKLGTVYLLEAVLNINVDTIYKHLKNTFNKSTQWNKQVIETRVLKELSYNTRIQYHVSASSGPVASRDFVSINCVERRGKSYISASQSCVYSDQPEHDTYVRGVNLCNGFVATSLSGGSRCEMRWVFSNNLKLWVPKSIIDRAMKTVLLQFHDSLLNLVSQLNSQ